MKKQIFFTIIALISLSSLGIHAESIETKLDRLKVQSEMIKKSIREHVKLQMKFLDDAKMRDNIDKVLKELRASKTRLEKEIKNIGEQTKKYNERLKRENLEEQKIETIQDKWRREQKEKELAMLRKENAETIKRLNALADKALKEMKR